MEDESQPDSARVFSVRIVDIDYYMAPPIPEMDICYSSFQGGKVNEVPVIRIFGSTPAGQKTCLHIHKAFPYLYIPCSDIQLALDVQQGDDGYKHTISHALEKALKLKGKVGSKRQHVHACSLVRARKLYGYFSTEELFVKIYLYHPQDVARAANLLLGGAVFDKCLQPHEAHIPFILQFLVDYNLYGMGHVHLSKMKFRHPLPDRVTQPCIKNQLSDKLNCSPPSSKADSPVWISSTVPASWMWQVPDTLSSSPDHKIQLVKRLSTCMLEGDSTTDEILNQHHKVFLSQSQTCSDVKMVQSLIPIWEEEYERTGLSDAYRDPPPDPGKPCQADVLKILLIGSGMEKSIMELLHVAESSSNPIDEDVKLIQPMPFLNNVGKTDELEKAAFIGNMDRVGCSIDTKVFPGSTWNEPYTASVDKGKAVVSEQMEAVGTLTPKSSVEEILGVLKWLASSQAGEDINSDDELLRETILNPLLPAASINMVLEKASNDYDSASQLECQDILNSIEAANDDDCINKKLEFIDDTLTPQTPQTPSKNGIPQADGFHIDRCNNPRSYTSLNFKSAEASHSPHIDTSLNFESAEAFQPHELLENSRLTSKEKGGRRWGVLPFSIQGSVIDNHQDVCFNVVNRSGGEATLSDSSEKDRNPNIPVNNATIDPSVVTATLASCSLRDLMRKKRSYRVSSPEFESNRGKRGRIKEQQDLSTWICANSEPLSVEGHHHLKSLGPHDLKSPSTEFDTKITEHQDTNSASYGELSTSLRNSSHFQINTTTERCDNSSAVGLDIVSKSVMLEDSSPLPFDNYLHGSLKPSCTISDLKSSGSVLPRESEPLLDADFSSYEPVSKSYVDKPIEQMGLDVPCLSSGFPLDDKEMNICQNSESGILGKCVRNLSYEVLHGTHARLQIGSCDDEHSRMNHSTACGSLPVLNIEGETAGVHKTTICDESEPEEQGGGNLSDECPSQFVKDSYEEMEDQNTYSSKDDDPSCLEEALTDVPAHHCIDGSVVYMLAPASIPPTTESVCSWLLKLDSAAHSSEERLLDIFSHSASPHMDRSSSEDRENKIMVVGDGRDVGKFAFVNEAENLKKVCNNSSQDFSQISGPCGKSRTTPLSQTGFRDPASIGYGQQLTLLSLEILAESRGDLRPDPRYDAIKVLAFAVKDDSDSGASLHALLHTPESNERNLDGLLGCSILHFYEEKQLFMYLVDFICLLDPDILLGWDIQGGSLGFLAERASQLGISLLNKISRTPSETKMDCSDSDGLDKIFHVDEVPEHENSDFILRDGGTIEDEWGRTHASGLHIDGRIVLNVWRLMRSEVKLTMYTIEAVAEAVLRRKVSLISNKVLMSWFFRGPSCARFRSIEYVVERAKLNLEIMDQLDMINRTSELARVFGIEFFSVLSRGSQYRVESMLLRLAHLQNYIAISPGSQQVATQPAMECLPLVMEPKSGFYADPVIVLDFQSLYPSMIIAYNLCFCTCLGKLAPPKPNILGVSSYSPELHLLHKLKDQMLFTPNGVMFVPPEVRKGILPRLLDEILSTRIMVKQAMKKLDPSQKVLQRIFNSRQLALKLISNVTYGYTAAGFSGRMPCAELADSIVQCGRRTLETAISFVNANEMWKAQVIYGDTDSMFVLLEGRTVEEAFHIGKEIATAITSMNPDPVTLKMEKVYHPCFLLTKKRYVGYSYESPDQAEPVFDAKGIETVRRDTCGAVAKTMEQSLRLYFESQDISKVKSYLQRQWKRIISGRISLQDFIFAKEVRLGTYSTRNSSSLPPAAIVATKAMRVDPRAEPRYGERIPYIVVHGDPGARLVDMVVDPLDLLALDSPFRLNDQYYINKQIIPALQRIFGLVGADLNQWLSEIPRPIRDAFGKRQYNGPNSYRARIDHYYISKHCVLCGQLAQSSKHFCDNCSRNRPAMAATVIRKTSKLERDMQHLAAICRHCGGGDWLVESGVKCTSLACSVFFERRKVQKELQGMSAVATEASLYPKCMPELF